MMVIKLFTFVLFFLSSIFVHALATPTWSGQPPILNDESFVSMMAYRIQNPKLDWINRRYFVEKGIPISSGQLSKEFLDRIFNEWAYYASQDNATVQKLLNPREQKIFFADYYGGSGGGDLNWGSGRAASAGDFNIKGLGKTPLAHQVDIDLSLPSVDIQAGAQWLKNSFASGWKTGGKKLAEKISSGIISGKEKLEGAYSDWSHSHGDASKREAIAEAIWGEILQRELPFGSNRILAIISAGGITLIVRENSIRPAHFMPTDGGTADDNAKETQRIDKLISEKLLSSLPLAQGEFKSENQEIYARLLQMTKNIAAQYGTLYARKLYHGSTSPSNIEISGKTLDLTSMTALSGHMPAKLIDDYVNGETDPLCRELLFEFFQSLRSHFGNQSGAVPRFEDALKEFKKSFKINTHREFVWLLGVPKDFLDMYGDSLIVQELGAILFRISSRRQTSSRDVRFYVPENEEGKKFQEILKKLLTNNHTEIEMREALKSDLTEFELNKLVNSFLPFYHKLSEYSQSKKVTHQGLDNYLLISHDIRNANRKKLYRGINSWVQDQVASVKNIFQEGAIGNFIEKMVGENSLSLPDEEGFKLFLKEDYDYKTGTSIKKFYDGQVMQYYTFITAEIFHDSVNIEGKVIPLSQISDYQRLNNSGIIAKPIQFQNDGKHIIMLFIDGPLRNPISLKQDVFFNYSCLNLFQTG